MMSHEQEQIIEAAKSYVKQYLEDDSSGHDTYHVFRVYDMACALAKRYDVSQFIVGITALLHDLDDPKISKGTTRAITFLNQHNIAEKELILDIIHTMSFSSHLKGKIVESIEGKIVQDADRLDALGAIGIARTFAYSGYQSHPLYKGSYDDDSAIAHFYQKLLKLPALMNTQEAKQIAKKRVKIMKDYLNHFYLEWEVKE